MKYYHYIFLYQLPLSTIPLYLIFTLDAVIIKEYANMLAWLGLIGLLSGVTIPITMFVLPNLGREKKGLQNNDSVKESK